MLTCIYGCNSTERKHSSSLLQGGRNAHGRCYLSAYRSTLDKRSPPVPIRAKAYNAVSFFSLFFFFVCVRFVINSSQKNVARLVVASCVCFTAAYRYSAAPILHNFYVTGLLLNSIYCMIEHWDAVRLQ